MTSLADELIEVDEMVCETKPFDDWLSEFESSEIHVNPSVINDEAIANLWAFSPVRDSSLTEWNDFISRLAAIRNDQLGHMGTGVGTMRLYIWHDQKAGQLRLSLVSTSHGCLPFSASVASASLDDVLRSLLGQIELPLVPVLVWSITIPTRIE